MIKGIYTIRDEASQLYMSLQTNETEQLAIRNFDYALQSNEMMKFQPQDFSLWCIGSYDDVTGVITAQNPKVIKRGVKRGK